jgi:hypothetical protein
MVVFIINKLLNEYLKIINAKIIVFFELIIKKQKLFLVDAIFIV